MTTKSFDANRRRKVYPTIRKSPVIRFESDTSGGGGGGTPLGVATIWPDLADLSDLFTSIPNPRTGDRVTITGGFTELDPETTIVAQFSETDGWQLVYGMFTSVDALLDFNVPIVTGAIVGVEQSGSDDETAVRFQYDGSAWVRTPMNQPYTWVLSDLTTLDPSGIGCTRDGDVGELNGRLYVLATLTKDADAGGGTLQAWVDPAYTLHIVSAYLVGTEADDAARTAVGMTTVLTNAGTATGNHSDSATRLEGYPSWVSGQPSAAELRPTSLVSAVPTGAVYIRAEVRAVVATGGTDNFAGFTIFDGTAVGRTMGFKGNAFGCVGGGSPFRTLQSGGSIRGGGSILPTSDFDLIEICDDGRTELTRVYRNGELYHSLRRDATGTTSNVIQIAGYNNGGTGVTFDIKNVLVTYEGP